MTGTWSWVEELSCDAILHNISVDKCKFRKRLIGYDRGGFMDEDINKGKICPASHAGFGSA